MQQLQIAACIASSPSKSHSAHRVGFNLSKQRAIPFYLLTVFVVPALSMFAVGLIRGLAR